MAKKKVVADGVSLGTVATRRFRLQDINPAAYNPRMITDEALAGLSESLRRFGCVEPIIVNVRDGKNVIVGGHQRHKALTMQGIEYADCVIVDLSDNEERLLNLSLNNPHIAGEFIKDLPGYIDQLRSSVGDNQAMPNAIVFDGFLGSGSTLIACEQTGRKCYGMEIDPKYCDVIVNRWEKFTDKKAKRCKR